jgi:hypothetical protein
MRHDHHREAKDHLILCIMYLNPNNLPVAFLYSLLAVPLPWISHNSLVQSKTHKREKVPNKMFGGWYEKNSHINQRW